MEVLMRRLLMLSLLICSSFLQAQSTFSTDRLKDFYDEFLCEEKNATAEVHVTGPCTTVLPNSLVEACGTIRDRPTIAPLAQASSTLDLIPIVLVNDTGLLDTDVYVCIYGKIVSGCSVSGPTIGNFSFVDFGTNPGGPFTATGTTPATAQPTVMPFPASTDYSYKFSDIPLTNGQRIVYVPQLDSGIILISINSTITLTVNANSIATPNPGLAADPAYNEIYGGLEFTFYPNNCPPPPSAVLNALTIDFTCVDYFGIPLYINLFTENPLARLPKNRPSGIYQSRAYTLCALRNAFASALNPASLTQWSGLEQKLGMTTLRIISPGNAMAQAVPSFDVTYLDNAASYDYSWANDVWTGADAYYTKNILTITTNDGTSYNGKVVSGVFTFVSSKDTFGVPWSNVSSPPTTTAIFNVASFFPNMTYSAQGSGSSCIIGAGGCTVPGDALTRATEITQYLSAVIPAGMVPGKVNLLTPSSFPRNVIPSYYTPNSNLTSPGTTTGPWYDLYSLGLHGNADITGNAVYAYAYDDYLYKNVKVNQQVAPSQLAIDSSTYITIVVGPYSAN